MTYPSERSYNADIQGCDFKDIAGSHNIYNDSVHNENCPNGITTIHIDSRKDRPGPASPYDHHQTRGPYSDSTSTTAFFIDLIFSLVSPEKTSSQASYGWNDHETERASTSSPDHLGGKFPWKTQASLLPLRPRTPPRVECELPEKAEAHIRCPRFKSKNPYRTMCNSYPHQ
ncbi:hypothetical protein FPV67DRAFT_115730 [Lyophyllum atratum]|nr:hypothetical protein FPV67DRAFT_115730 [Lyophyllum atratum]